LVLAELFVTHHQFYQRRPLSFCQQTRASVVKSLSRNGVRERNGGHALLIC
jgi:hypothetical protein